MISVEVQLKRSFEVSASPDEAFALVADIHRSGMHFPGVTSLSEIDGSGRWRWVLGERGFGPVKVSPRYDSVYQSNQDELSVRWSPAADSPGDMESSGSWKIEPTDTGSRLTFVACTVAHIPAPGIMRGMVEAFTREELLRLKGQYLDAIARTLNEPG